MDKDKLNKLKHLYNKGYKCIKYEENSNGELTAYFKNFEEEKIDELTSSVKSESKEIKNFIDGQSFN